MVYECTFRDNKYAKIIPLMLGGEQCERCHTYGPAVRMYYLVHYVCSGAGTYEVNGKVYHLTKGEAFVIKPHEITKYSADKDTPWEYVWVGFSSEISRFNELPYVIKDDNLKNIIEGVYASGSYKTKNNAMAFSESWRIISYLLNGVLEEESFSYPNAVVNLIKARFMNKLTVQSIADELGLDRSYLSNIFKSEYGVSPQQYIINYRMERALELLSTEKYSVSVVAASVGYSDLFVFSRAFKKHFGVPPMKFKRVMK